MSIEGEAELEQYVLQTHNSKKILKIQLGFKPPSPLLVRQWCRV